MQTSLAICKRASGSDKGSTSTSTHLHLHRYTMLSCLTALVVRKKEKKEKIEKIKVLDQTHKMTCEECKIEKDRSPSGIQVMFSV